MRLPSLGGATEWLHLDKVKSTQTEAASLLQQGNGPSIIIARNQTLGRGRFGRPWIGKPGSSLAASLIFSDYADHNQPWLIGMTIAATAAAVLHCRVQWPNDLILQGKKVGGILTEMLADRQGRLVPVVGIGVNLGKIDFPPDIADRATSLSEHMQQDIDDATALTRILQRLPSMPEPTKWQELEPVWRLFDATPGKRYCLADGQEAEAFGVGPMGELLCSVEGESTAVMAADALFGADP